MRRRLRHAMLALAALCLAYAIWSRLDRTAPTDGLDLRLVETRAIGKDTGNGNLLGIQPYMVPGDYASEARFYAKLSGYFAAAHKAGFLCHKTVVVLPEYLGVWLVTTGEKRAVYRARTTKEAITILAASNLPSFLLAFSSSKAPDRITCAVFNMKAGSMTLIYDRVFSRLAKEYGVTIVAGSIILPAPQVRGGRLVIGRGPLFNASVVYGAGGRALGPVVRKAFLTTSEREFLEPGAAQDTPVFSTPAGRLGVLICADSWHPPAYRALRTRDVHAVAVPAFLPRENGWEKTWRGYDTRPAPGDIKQGDQGHISEGRAWEKYALPGRMRESGARAGITTFLRGELWDLGSDGRTLAVSQAAAETSPKSDGAALVSLWLGAR